MVRSDWDVRLSAGLGWAGLAGLGWAGLRRGEIDRNFGDLH